MKRVWLPAVLFISLAGFAPPARQQSAAAPNISGSWDVTIFYKPDDADFVAPYTLKQDGEKLTGTYNGTYGPAEVSGTVRGRDVTMSVTVKGGTARFVGTIDSATMMSGTVTGTSDRPRKWSAVRKK
jgi:hypothetical protein